MENDDGDKDQFMKKFTTIYFREHRSLVVYISRMPTFLKYLSIETTHIPVMSLPDPIPSFVVSPCTNLVISLGSKIGILCYVGKIKDIQREYDCPEWLCDGINSNGFGKVPGES